MAFEILDQDGCGLEYQQCMPLLTHSLSLLAAGFDSCSLLMQSTVICESAS